MMRHLPIIAVSLVTLFAGPASGVRAQDEKSCPPEMLRVPRDLYNKHCIDKNLKPNKPSEMPQAFYIEELSKPGQPALLICHARLIALWDCRTACESIQNQIDWSQDTVALGVLNDKQDDRKTLEEYKRAKKDHCPERVALNFCPMLQVSLK